MWISKPGDWVDPTDFCDSGDSDETLEFGWSCESGKCGESDESGESC